MLRVRVSLLAPIILGGKAVIPKMIHVVWIGPKPYPYEKELDTWLKHNPDWNLKLWTNDDLPFLLSWMKNTWAYEKLPYWSGKVNVIRFELLYKYGGVYSDADSYCLKPLDGLINGVKCFGMTNNSGRGVSAATLGAIPGHPAFGEIVKKLEPHIRALEKSKQKYFSVHKVSGSHYITPILRKYNDFVQFDKGKKKGSRELICTHEEVTKKTYILQYHAGHDTNWDGETEKGKILIDKEKTEEDLNNISRGLQEVAWILNENKVKWFLCCGALLGAYRDGDFIPWDHDVDIDAATMSLSQFHRIVQSLKDNGFEIKTRLRRNEPFKITAKKYHMPYVIRIWEKKGEYWRLRSPASKLPKKLFDNTGRIEIRGVLYPCPKDTEQYLEWVYGSQWKTPIKGNHYRDYTTKNYLLKR